MDVNIERKSGYEVNGEKHRDANACMEKEDQPARSSAVTHATIKRALKYGHDDEMVLESGEFQRSATSAPSYHCDETTQVKKSVGECKQDDMRGNARVTGRHSECHVPSQEACENTDR